MHTIRKHSVRKLILCLAFSWLAVPALAFYKPAIDDSLRPGGLQEAILYIKTLDTLHQSKLWPNVQPGYFRENLDLYVKNPLFAFDNKNTNFCGYTAISFVTLEMDPLGFMKFLVQLYTEGKAKMGKTTFEPRKEIRLMAGNLKYKGMLDINPATQMWYLTLADHYKGYLNIFNRRYDAGDENTMWASTNFAKFNRMLRQLFKWKVHARGADLVHPPIHDLYAYISEKKKTGIVFLYLNNRLLYKKKHVIARVGIPTHYVLLQEISKENGQINIIYMDGGRKTKQQISPDLLKKIVFGVTYCTVK